MRVTCGVGGEDDLVLDAVMTGRSGVRKPWPTDSSRVRPSSREQRVWVVVVGAIRSKRGRARAIGCVCLCGGGRRNGARAEE